MNFDKPALQSTLSSISALVYRASQVELGYKQLIKLEADIAKLESSWPRDARHAGTVDRICLMVRTGGILCLPASKPTDTETIMADCDRLRNFLEDYKTSDSN